MSVPFLLYLIFGSAAYKYDAFWPLQKNNPSSANLTSQEG